jgi:hypothetical protein
MESCSHRRIYDQSSLMKRCPKLAYVSWNVDGDQGRSCVINEALLGLEETLGTQPIFHHKLRYTCLHMIS